MLGTSAPDRLLAIALGCFACAGMTVVAEAQDAPPPVEDLSLRDQEARQLFEAGRLAFTDGRFGDALDYFRRSHELSGRPELLFNIGSAADRLRRNQEALEAFEAYLAALPDAPNRREVEGRIEVLRATPPAESVQPRPDPLAPAPAAADDRSLLSQWWFWTILGAAVVGGVVATVLLLDDGPDYRSGDDGAVYFTLELP